MRAYEIEGWLTGTRIRLSHWPVKDYVWFCREWLTHEGTRWEDSWQHLLFDLNVWEAWQEPKKPVAEVKWPGRVPRMGDIVLVQLHDDLKPAVVMKAPPFVMGGDGYLHVHVFGESDYKMIAVKSRESRSFYTWQWP